MGDGVVDDTVAVQLVINSTPNGGTVFFPKGYYLFNSPVFLKSELTLIGVGGYAGSVLVAGLQNAIFQLKDGTVTDFVDISKLAFTGAGGYGIYLADYQFYMSTFHIHHCDFFGDLKECIFANMILCDIENNVFGYHGNVGASHRHIYCKGNTNGNSSNINRIINNRMYSSIGLGASCYFEAGYQVLIEGNNFESLSTPALSINGLYLVVIRANWFEAINNQYMIYFNNSTDETIGNYIVKVEENMFAFTNALNMAVFNVSGATAIMFNYNAGFGSNKNISGPTINQNILESKFNRISGSTIPTI